MNWTNWGDFFEARLPLAITVAIIFIITHVVNRKYKKTLKKTKHK